MLSPLRSSLTTNRRSAKDLQFVKTARNVKETDQPLAGCRVLVSRAKKQAEALSSALRAVGCQVVAIPFIEIRKPTSFKPLDTALGNLASYDWLILTSVNGVEAMFERLNKRGISGSELMSLKITAIGPATRKAVEARGHSVAVTPKGATGTLTLFTRSLAGRR